MKSISPELAQELWDAAPRLIDDHGNLNMSRVCAELGVPRATLYYYFSGKADLAAFFARELIRRAAAVASDAAAEPGGSVSERLEVAIRSIYSLPNTHPDVSPGMLLFITSHGASFPLMEELREFAFAPIRKLLMEGRDAGEFDIGDIEVALTTVFGALEIVAAMNLRQTGRLPEDAVHQALGILLRGLQHRPSP